jgi:hypothetical protein
MLNLPVERSRVKDSLDENASDILPGTDPLNRILEPKAKVRPNPFPAVETKVSLSPTLSVSRNIADSVIDFDELKCSLDENPSDVFLHTVPSNPPLELNCLLPLNICVLRRVLVPDSPPLGVNARDVANVLDTVNGLVGIRITIQLRDAIVPSVTLFTYDKSFP